MNCSIIKKAKIFFVAALVIIVAGLAMFGFLGFNQTVDYRDSYEVQVGVDQNAGDAIAIMNDTTSAYFAEKGIKPLSSQVADDGLAMIYKFSADVGKIEAGLEDKINSAIKTANVSNVSAEVSVREVVAGDNTNVANVIIAMSVAIVLMFIYAVIFEKLASAVAVAFATVLSAVMFIAFMGITRIPAAPFVVIGGALAVVLAAIVSIATVNKYKAEYKKADKCTNLEIVEKVASKAKTLYIILGGAVLLTAVALCALGLPYVMLAGAQVLVAGISGISAAVFGTPFMWSLIKKDK